MSVPSKNWYLVFAKPRQESVAQTHLVRQGYETYLPLAKEVVRRAGRRVTRIGPMFPRYLFIWLDREFDNWSPIRSTVGVVSVVRFGNTPAQVPTALIGALRQREDAAGMHVLPVRHPQPGSPVKIVDGSFAGYEAIFVAQAGRHRVTLLLDLLGKHTRAVVDATAVEPL